MTDLIDRPRPPAEAYFVMVDLLPDWYLQQRPPAHGTRLVVTGHDGVPTTWYLTNGLAGVMHQRVAADRRVRRVLAFPFDDRQADAA